MGIRQHDAYGKEYVFRLLRQRGALKAVCHFSGGNDEGGVDNIVLHFPDGTKSNLEIYYDGPEWEQVDGKWVEKKKAALTPAEEADKELSGLLQGPIEGKYGSWAGEFSAHGTLTWDVKKGEALWDEYVQSGYEHYSGSF